MVPLPPGIVPTTVESEEAKGVEASDRALCMEGKEGAESVRRRKGQHQDLGLGT